MPERAPVETRQPRRPGFRALAAARGAAALWTLMASATGEEGPRAAGARTRRTLDRLGGLWVKLGEYLSLQDGVLPGGFCRELGELYDRATGFPAADARRIVEEDLGKPIGKIFSEFEDEPIAAASVAQVHRAVLAKGNRPVVVKVRRPDVADTFGRDLALARKVLSFLGGFESFRHWRLDDGVATLTLLVKDDLDFRREAANTRMMRPILRAHGFHVPRVWYSLSSERVLVQERLDGISFARILDGLDRDPEAILGWLAARGVRLPDLARRVLHSVLRQILEEPCFHGDPHPGNVLVLEDGRLAMIDFGTVGRLEPGFQRLLARYLQCVSRREYQEAASRLVMLFQPIPAIDVDELKRDLIQAYREWDAKAEVKALPYDERSYVSGWAKLAAVANRYRLPLNWDAVLVDRAFQAVNVCLKHARPGVNHLKEFRRYFARAGRRLLSRTSDPREALALSLRYTQSIEGLPRRLSDMGEAFGNISRRSAIGIEATTDTVASILHVVFRWFGFLVTCGILGLAAVFVHQNVHPMPLVGDDSLLLGAFHGLPELRAWDYLFLAAALVLAGRTVRGVKRRLGKRESGHQPLFD